MTLSEGQQECFNKYLNNENIFITGPGGSGKSFLIREIVNHAKDNAKKIKICALTGCAAILLQCGATTLHAFSGIGLATNNIDNIIHDLFTKKKHKLKNWHNLDILIVDEVSMMSLKIFILLDKIARLVFKKPDIPFGGLQVIFTGDFYQLSPVNNDDKDKEAGMFCFQNHLWDNVFKKENQIVLTTIFRQNDDMLLKILKYIRKGQITPKTKEALEKRIFNKNEIIELKKNKILTIMSPIKKDVEKINTLEYDNLDSKDGEYIYNIKYINNSKDNDINEEMFNLYLKSNTYLKSDYDFLANNIMGEKVIKFKVGTHVMCIINLVMEGENQIANGCQGVIVGFENGLPLVLFNNIEKPILIGYYTWNSETNKKVSVAQIPLIYAWAITIHKAQGVTLDNAIIDIGSNIFADGQTYVALSRVKTLDGIYLTSFDYKKIKCNSLVRQFYGD